MYCFQLLLSSAACGATPSDNQLHRIYSTLLNNKLTEFHDELKPLGDPITKARRCRLTLSEPR
jgi:hypothetical protein